MYLCIIGGHLACFHLLVIMNNTAMNVNLEIYAQVPAFNYFRYITRNGDVGSYGNSVFNFLRICSTVFHGDYTILHPTSVAQGF
jgi:hypothetical protein